MNEELDAKDDVIEKLKTTGLASKPNVAVLVNSLQATIISLEKQLFLAEDKISLYEHLTAEAEQVVEGYKHLHTSTKEMMTKQCRTKFVHGD